MIFRSLDRYGGTLATYTSQVGYPRRSAHSQRSLEELGDTGDGGLLTYLTGVRQRASAQSSRTCGSPRADSSHRTSRSSHALHTHTHRTCRSSRTHVSPVTLSPVTHVHPRLRHAALSVTCMLPAASVARSSRPPRRARRPSRLVVHSLLMSHIVVLSGPSAPLRPPAPRVVRRIGRCAVARVRSPPPPSCLPPPRHCRGR